MDRDHRYRPGRPLTRPASRARGEGGSRTPRARESRRPAPARPQLAPRTIALLVPVTSRRRVLRSVNDCDFLRKLFPSFLRTATWDGRTRYRLYMGYDRGDRFYDRPARLLALRAAVAWRSRSLPVGLVVECCTGTTHAPCAVWNALFRRACDDGADFFYQLGDDVVLETVGWATAFPLVLETMAGVGVTGPLDRNNPRLLTQSFVSRTHMEIFGAYFPGAFRNWWSDDWITEVYQPDHLRPIPSQTVNNAGTGVRYEVDYAGAALLPREVAAGREVLARWLRARRGLDARG